MKELIVVFDVDGTLLNSDCLLIAAKNSTSLDEFLLGLFYCLPWFISWKLELMNDGRLKEKVLSKFKICELFNSLDDYNSWILNLLKNDLNQEALKALIRHQDLGHRVLLCTASPRILIEPLANYLNVELVCTELLRTNNHYKPQLISPNCKGPEKVRRLGQYLGPLNSFIILQ